MNTQAVLHPTAPHPNARAKSSTVISNPICHQPSQLRWSAKIWLDVLLVSTASSNKYSAVCFFSRQIKREVDGWAEIGDVAAITAAAAVACDWLLLLFVDEDDDDDDVFSDL